MPLLAAVTERCASRRLFRCRLAAARLLLLSTGWIDHCGMGGEEVKREGRSECDEVDYMLRC